MIWIKVSAFLSLERASALICQSNCKRNNQEARVDSMREEKGGKWMKKRRKKEGRSERKKNWKEGNLLSWIFFNNEILPLQPQNLFHIWYEQLACPFFYPSPESWRIRSKIGLVLTLWKWSGCAGEKQQSIFPCQKTKRCLLVQGFQWTSLEACSFEMEKTFFENRSA